MNKLNMLKRIGLFTYVSGVSMLQVQAEDPSIDHANGVIKGHLDTGFNFWDGGLQQPEGGMVLRMKTDVNRDGIDDWLYQSTIPSDPDLHGWTIYLNNGSSTTKLTGSVRMGGIVYVKYEKNRTIFTSVYNLQDWLSVIRNYVNFDTGEITNETEIYEGIENVSEAAYRDYGKIIVVKDQEAISLQALVYGNAQWLSHHKTFSKEEKEEMFPEVFTREMATEYLASIESEAKEIKEEVSSSAPEKSISEEPKKATTNKLPWFIMGGTLLIMFLFFKALRGNSK